MQRKMNLKIKYRESFRPFAPSVLAEDAADYFDLGVPSPYMQLVATVTKSKRIELTVQQQKMTGLEQLGVARSEIPAVTHVDNTARVQTVDDDVNPTFSTLLRAFKRKTGSSVLINTSFNVRGEPIVCTPQDAFACFMSTEMDVLVLENIIIYKEEQLKAATPSSSRGDFELD